MGMGGGSRAVDKSAGASPSTGDKNLDLLLEMRGNGSEADKQAAAQSGKAASALTLGAGLRAAAMAAAPKAEPTAQGHVFGGDDSLGAQQGQQPKLSRDWSGDGTRLSGQTEDSSDRSARNSAAQAYSGGDAGAPGLSTKVMSFLRENRYLLLTVGGAVLLGMGLLTAQSRRG